MKYFTRYILFSLVFIHCQHLSAQDTAINQYKFPLTNKLGGWTKSFTGFNLADFKKEGSSAFEQMDFMNIADTAEFYSIYKPALSFSPDNSRFIDIYSYWLNLEREGKKIISRGGEPEQVVSFCDLKTKKWQRILFRGTTERIQDVTWISNTKFILVGVRQDDQLKEHPVIYIADTKHKTFSGFVSINNNTIQKSSGYTSPKLLKLKIKEK